MCFHKFVLHVLVFVMFSQLALCFSIFAKKKLWFFLLFPFVCIGVHWLLLVFIFFSCSYQISLIFLWLTWLSLICLCLHCFAIIVLCFHMLANFLMFLQLFTCSFMCFLSFYIVSLVFSVFRSCFYWILYVVTNFHICSLVLDRFLSFSCLLNGFHKKFMCFQ